MLALFADAHYNRDFTDLRAHLTNTCRHSSADSSASTVRERDSVKLLSEIPKVLPFALDCSICLVLSIPPTNPSSVSTFSLSVSRADICAPANGPGLHP